MAGKKKPTKSRKKGKSKGPMSHIGSALLPRAMFAAVPRSPEPPAEPPEERPPSALSSALLNASLVGRIIATRTPPPPDSGTLRSTGEGVSTWPRMAHHHQDAGNASMENSMARSSMYDYDESDEEDGEEQDYDEAGYSTIPLAQAVRQKRNTISNRAKLVTPVHSQSDSMLSSDDDEDNDAGNEGIRPQDHAPLTKSGQEQERFYHILEKDEGVGHEGVDGRRPSSTDENVKRSKERRRKDGRTAPDSRVEDLYAKSRKHKKQPVQRQSADLSESSSLTMVTSPQEDDFSDLITPPPPWKRKGKKKNKKKGAGVSPDRLTEEDARSERSQRLGPEDDVDSEHVHEPIVERIEASSVSAMQQSQPPVPAPRSASRQSQDESETYSHIQRQPSVATLQSHAAQEEEYLRRTNSRLERELEMVQREREQLLEGLKSMSPPPHQPRRQLEDEGDSERLRMGIQRLTSINDDTQRQLDEMHQHCDKLRLENEAIKEVNDRLHTENTKLRDLSESIKNEDHSQQVLMRQQAEEVLGENEQLKMVIHKLNIQLSRYQAKHSPPQKSDPPGLPSRGRTPRWLTDTKHLSPLIMAYEDALKDKDEMIKLAQEDLSRLRKSAEEVIHENQRLHLKLEQVGQPTSVTPTEWHRIQEHARLVLEENQVVLSQLDILQRKQKDMQRAHSLEVSKMSKRLAIEESEKDDLEAQLTDLKHRYSALKQQHDRSVVDAETKMPIQEHMSTLAEYKRGLEEEQRSHQAEMENVFSKLSSTQGEKKTLALRVADSEAERSQMQGEIKALGRVQKKLQHKIALLQKELEHSENKLALSNQHLNKVLEIAEQTAAERDALTKVAKSQEQEKKKAVNKMIEGNVTIGRLEEKLKSYRQKADVKLGNLSSRIEAQDSSHISQLREYEREMAHLKTLLQQKQDSLDILASEKRKVEEQLETVWQTASADNRRMKAKLKKSLREPHLQNGALNGGAFEYESDNRGLISSESD
ncbi:centrosomal protein of 89 kDa-like [Patiria miniata]|uniref:Centrosomal protein of 89 kDa n=1 Tax=Patiria miniata TaxID=46514 RepID=A0A914AWG0_PATMI|nr:centrosomal protein of 89 kDa-like [Patiria miniata]